MFKNHASCFTGAEVPFVNIEAFYCVWTGFNGEGFWLACYVIDDVHETARNIGDQYSGGKHGAQICYAYAELVI